MDARTELFAYMGAALATIIGLFTLQIWYASYLDVDVVHAQHPDAPLDAKVAAVRAEEQKKLSSGRRPLAAAKRELAQRPRASLSSIAPKQSADLTPMSGWINRPGFAAYEPRSQPAAAAAPSAEGAPADGAPADGSTPAQQPSTQPAGGKAP
jgi:hypothetical protein